jgi:hypothetical protein
VFNRFRIYHCCYAAAVFVRRFHSNVVKSAFGIDISIASVNRLRNEVSNALLIPVQDAQDYVKVAPVVHSDETSFKQGNGDGKNQIVKKGWLWTVVSGIGRCFEVALSRAKPWRCA